MELYNNDLKDHFTAYKNSCNINMDDDDKFELLATEKRWRKEISLDDKDLENLGEYQLIWLDERAQKQIWVSSSEGTLAIIRLFGKGKAVEKSVVRSLIIITKMKKVKVKRYIRGIGNLPIWNLEIML